MERKTMKKIILLLGLLVLGVLIVAGCKAKKDDGGAGAAPAKAEEKSNIVSKNLEGITVSGELPKQLWCTRMSSDEIEFFNVPTEKDISSASPRIGVKVKNEATFEYFDMFKKHYTEIKSVPNKTIGGIDMKGRTYKYVGMEWIEYMGKIDEDHVVLVRTSINESSYVDIESGEGKAVLDSIKFEKTAE